MAVSYIEEAITEAFGERCPDFDADCRCCKAWAELDQMNDKIEGLEADLENAVETAFGRGATEWTRLNYPNSYARLTAVDKTDGVPDASPHG